MDEDVGTNRNRYVGAFAELQYAGEFGRRHADDREADAVDRDDSTDRVGSSAKAALPVTPRNHRRRRRIVRFVDRRQQPAAIRLHAEARVVVARDVLAGRHFGAAVRNHVQLLDGRECEHVREGVGLRAQALVGDVGKRRAFGVAGQRIVGRRGSVVSARPAQACVLRVPHHQRELVGISNGQRFEQHRVDDGKERRVGADAEGERENDDRGESGIAAHRADGESQVGGQAVDQTLPADVADVVLGGFDAAELGACRTRRLVSRDAAAELLVDCALEIGAYFVVEVGVDLAPAKEGAKAAAEPRQHQISPCDVRRMRAIAAIWLSHSRVSTRSFRRPASVRL